MAEKEIYLLQNTVFLELFPLPVRGGLPKWSDPLLLPQRTTVCRCFTPGKWRGRELLSLLAHWVHEAVSPAVLEAHSRQLWNRVWELSLQKCQLGFQDEYLVPVPRFHVSWLAQIPGSLSYLPPPTFSCTHREAGFWTLLRALVSYSAAIRMLSPSVLQTDSSYMSVCHTPCDLLSLLISTFAYLLNIWLTKALCHCGWLSL